MPFPTLYVTSHDLLSLFLFIVLFNPLTRFHPQKCPLFGSFFVSFVGFVVCIFSCLVTFAFQTIGASFLQKHVTVDDNRITLQIWDTAGQERFRAMAPLYYRKAKAAVVVFDVTDDRTFRKAKGWLDELKKHVARPDGVNIRRKIDKRVGWSLFGGPDSALSPER